ncbi:alcohol dehydrogenase catalytic domain-containing protein [Arthrobacter sp. Hz1]
MDVAGVIEAVGAGVRHFTPGDEVTAMLGSWFGGHAEYVCVPEDGTLRPSRATSASKRPPHSFSAAPRPVAS